MSLQQINGMWCPAGDPYFTPLLRTSGFYDQWVYDHALAVTGTRRVALDIGAHIGT